MNATIVFTRQFAEKDWKLASTLSLKGTAVARLICTVPLPLFELMFKLSIPVTAFVRPSRYQMDAWKSSGAGFVVGVGAGVGGGMGEDGRVGVDAGEDGGVGAEAVLD